MYYEIIKVLSQLGEISYRCKDVKEFKERIYETCIIYACNYNPLQIYTLTMQIIKKYSSDLGQIIEDAKQHLKDQNYNSQLLKRVKEHISQTQI